MDVATEAMASLLPKLAVLLKEEQYRLPTVIKEDIEFLSNELTRMQRHAVDWPRDDEQAGILAREARDLSNRVEKLLEKKACLFKKGKAARQVAGEIREVKDQVQEVATRWCEYNQLNAVIVANPTAPAATTSIDPLLLDPKEMGGIQEATDELIKTLSDDNMSSRQQLKVVSISAGFGGLGEANLAKAAYDRLQERYDCSAFVSVGQNPDTRKVFRDIMFSLNKKKYMSFDAKMLREKEKLVDLLREMLENKRYLIVVDDIWDSESWDDINRAWVGNAISNGSTVLMRRYIADVALGTSDFHTKLAPLARNQSTRLFRQPPFGDHYLHEFADISDEIIRNCSAMQLAMAMNMASLLPKLAELLKEEQSLPMGVKEDVGFISDELAQMQHGMADVPQDQLLDDEHPRLLVNKARDLYNCMEKLMEKKDNLFNKGKAASQIASEIREVKDQVKEVSTSWSQWYNKRSADPVVANLIAPTTTDDPKEMVGIQEATEKIIKTLSSREDSNISSRQQLKIVSISGFGGLGKTTLAKAAYDRVQERYEYTAFVSVGQNPDTRKVFRDIMFGLNKKKYMGFDARILREKEELIDLLRGMLENKRYLIVVDDIWDSESWDDISRALVGNSSSAVVMTSRNTDVARGAGGVHTKLAPLGRHDSTRLFWQTAFGGSGDHCPTEFSDISDKLVEKCSGMPLAIVTVASLLKGKPLKNWHAVQESNYFDHSDDMKKILALSYTDLPAHLRLCLLYLSMFGKGCEVSVDRLLWEWIAEGLFDDPGLGHEGGIMTWRERGEHYLRELINRGLVAAVDIGGGGRAVSCRVCSDIVHDLIVSLSASENFATILDDRKSSSSGWPENTPVLRRLSIQQGAISSSHLPPRVGLTDVKSLVVSGDAACMPSLSKFDALRVLDLCDVDALQNDHLKGITCLSGLKCLIMGGGSYSSTEIPLQNLQILDLRATCVKELPEGMAGAAGLKCLRVHSHTKIPAGMLARMQGLEELGDINVCKPGLLGELPNLKKLTILGVAMWSWDESYDDALLKYLTFLSEEERTVRSLSISACCSLQFLHKLDKKWAPPHLQNLEIKHSALSLLPEWIPSLQKNLTSLSLEVYKLSRGIIHTLGNLQNLLALCITSKHNPEQDGRFTTDGFRNLTSFNFVSNVMGKIFEPGAMLKLTRLRLSFDASRSHTKQVSPGFDFGLENLPSLEHARIKIICFGANRRQVEDAEDAISRAIRTASLEINKVCEKDILTEDGDKEEEEEEKPPQIADQVIKGHDESNKMSGYNDGEIPVTPDPCVQPNANESADKVNLLRQLMVDNMNLRLQLLNHDSRVNDMLRDFRLKDAEIVQAAIDRVEDLMKQNIGQRLSDKSSIVENRNTQNISNENMCAEQDNQKIAKIGTSEISEVLVHIEDVCLTKEIMEIVMKEFPHNSSEKYLDDKLINASIYCLRHKCPRDTRDEGNVFLEKTEICQLLHRDGKHAMSKGAIEKGENIETAKNYLNHDMIFLPLNCEQHWYLAVVSAKQHEIQVLDSVSSMNTEREELKLVLKGMETYLELAANEELNQENSWPDYKVTTWKIRLVEGLPKQEDSSSCGLFMLKYMEYWTGDRLSMKFVQDDINQFRRELASMLVNSPLNKIKNTKETEGCVL